MFGWASAEKLRPMRMVYLRNSSYSRYELVKWRRPSLRKTIIGLQGWNKVEDDRQRRLHYPRVIDEYGINRRPKS